MFEGVTVGFFEGITVAGISILILPRLLQQVREIQRCFAALENAHEAAWELIAAKLEQRSPTISAVRLQRYHGEIGRAVTRAFSDSDPNLISIAARFNRVSRFGDPAGESAPSDALEQLEEARLALERRIAFVAEQSLTWRIFGRAMPFSAE